MVGHEGIKVICGSEFGSVLNLGVGYCISDDFVQIKIAFFDDGAAVSCCFFVTYVVKDWCLVIESIL